MGMNQPAQPTAVYEGQFGEYTITPGDRRGVVLYRTGLVVAALAFAVGTGLGLVLPTNQTVVYGLSVYIPCSGSALGLSLATIHILFSFPCIDCCRAFGLVGGLASLAVAHYGEGPLV